MKFSRTPRYVLTGGLAIVFLFPLVWSAYSSVAPQANSGQVDGFGFGNYAALWNYNVGLPTFLRNSFIVAGLTLILTLVTSILGGYAFARFSFPGQEHSVPRGARGADGARTRLC